MSERDKTRSRLKNSNLSAIEKRALMTEYRKTRNEATKQIKIDKQNAIKDRIDRSNSESEIWKI